MAGEKRSQEREDAQRVEKIVVVDIEGTTTSIKFVKETLFPYVRDNLKDYVEKNWENAEFKEDFEKLKEQAKKDETDKVEGLVSIAGAAPQEEKESLIKNVLWQMDNDRKSGALKQLQGHMWREAYKSGAVKGHVYADVPKALEAWTKEGRKVYVYSSGSVEAQKLLFGHSEHGDLLKYFTDYFDTEIGAKQESSSYKNILSKIESEAKDVLFLTDIPKEAKAAIDAGMTSVIVVREGNADLTTEEKDTYTIIKSFEDLTFQSNAKRPKLEKTSEPEKEEVKKIEQTKVSETVNTTTEDVEMTDVSEKKVEKIEVEKKKIEVEKSETKVVEEVVEDKKENVTELPIPPQKTETEKKIETETVKAVETKADEKVEVQTKSEPSPKVTETKTNKVEKIAEESIAESKVEAEPAKKNETEKSNSEKPEEGSKKVVEEKTTEKPVESIVESAKSEEKKIEEKPVEEAKQNGDSKSAEVKESIPETKVTNGQKSEINGNAKVVEPSADEKKEAEKVVEPEDSKSEVENKAEPIKEEEKKKDEVEKKINGNSTETKENTHRNGVNEEKAKNGESSTDTDSSIKVKKVVETITDGAGEPDVVPPAVVVAATS